jgi:hypothetical protein
VPIIITGLVLLIVGFLTNEFLSPALNLLSPTPISTTISTPNISQTPIPTIPVIPTSQTTAYVDSDPIVNCGPGQISKQYVKDRSSKCVNYVDCGLNGNSVYTLMLKTECDKKHAESNRANPYPPCTINYPALGYSKTYDDLTPSDCSYYKQKAIDGSKPLALPTFKVAPIPTIEPYQYSQEYLDALNKFNQVVSTPFQPSQFVAPTPKCYATWDEYFNAHPNYAPQNITQMSGTPPCD